MDRYVTCGGTPLCGEVVIDGSKNSSLAILIATLAVDGECIISNIPNISDVAVALDILSYYGAEIQKISEKTVKINTENIAYKPIPSHLTVKMRASGYLLGALLARFNKCESLQSGGCDFGTRPMNLHYCAFSALGANEKNGAITAKGGLKGGGITFPIKSVGATINAIIASSKANGVTVIKNAAREPHVADLARFLNTCGAEIHGAGTDTVTVYGKNKLHGTRYTVDGDMIEAGTFLIAGLATGGKVSCINAPCAELGSLMCALRRMGADVSVSGNSISAHCKHLLPANIITAPYPAFPTDLQPQISALLGLARGESSVKETIFNNRFAYVDEIKNCGFTSNLVGNTLKIQGVPRYNGAKMKATDLRGGAAALICALNAFEISEITNIQLIERGYCNIITKLQKLGANIKKG